MKNVYIALLIFCSFTITIKSQNSDTIENSQLVFSLPVFDFPYQIDASKTVNQGQVSLGSFFKGYSNPSMHQSLDLSTDLYTGVHFGLNKLFRIDAKTNIRKDWSFGKRFLYGLTWGVSDYILIYAPGFDGWLHEEYHRAVMTRYHINSFNDMNKFPLGAELISVNHVKDEDLIRLKQTGSSDFIRMHVAGIEGEYLLIDKLQRNNFFYNQNLPHELTYLLVTLNSIMYVQISSIPEIADITTDELNLKENSINIRDFTGLDFTAWAYDLFRPNEPYVERGIHPSGIGIDRYIKTTDLTNEELSYLKQQGRLQWLNALSPMFFGVKSINIFNTGFSGNFSVRNFLTSFGNSISGNIYLANPTYKFHIAYHSNQNYNNSFPAIEMQLIDFEKTINSTPFYISPRLLFGMQPLNQEFKTQKSAFLGLAECRIELKSNKIINPFIEVSAKTKGWIAGNEFLDENLSCRFGIVTRIKTRK